MVADAFNLGLGFILVFGLLVVACLLLTIAMILLVGIYVNVYGTVVGIGLALIAGAGALWLTGDFVLTWLAFTSALVFGVVGGTVRWGDVESPGFVRGPLYRLTVSAVATGAVGAGVGLWVVLVGTAGPARFIDLVTSAPLEIAAIVLITAVPIVGGATTLYWIGVGRWSSDSPQ